jgi:hypothetical protein
MAPSTNQALSARMVLPEKGRMALLRAEYVVCLAQAGGFAAG